MDEIGSFNKKEAVMTVLMKPEHTNFGGDIHGGYLLCLLDQIAYCVAARYTSSCCVTLSVDRVLFKQPVKVGNLVSFYGKVNYVGNTSLEVGIKVMAEDIKTGERRHVNTSYFTMVAIDDNGKPRKITPITLDDDIEKRRYKAAEARKAERLKYKK